MSIHFTSAAQQDLYDHMVYFSPTRYEAKDTDAPNFPPPYVSMLEQLEAQGVVARNRGELRALVAHSFYLKAGQSSPPNGGLGMRATPSFVPEVLGGAVLSTSI